jgi:glucokinase
MGGFTWVEELYRRFCRVLNERKFSRSFSDKGRFRDLLKSIPVYVILNDQAALLGAAVHLCNERF